MAQAKACMTWQHVPSYSWCGAGDVVLRASNTAVASIETNHRSGPGRQESRLAELVVLNDRTKKQR